MNHFFRILEPKGAKPPRREFPELWNPMSSHPSKFKRLAKSRSAKCDLLWNGESSFPRHVPQFQNAKNPRAPAPLVTNCRRPTQQYSRPASLVVRPPSFIIHRSTFITFPDSRLPSPDSQSPFRYNQGISPTSRCNANQGTIGFEPPSGCVICQE
jgi:hypothetical protein